MVELGGGSGFYCRKPLNPAFDGVFRILGLRKRSTKMPERGFCKCQFLSDCVPQKLFGIYWSHTDFTGAFR
jgi:hypothetical protein